MIRVELLTTGTELLMGYVVNQHVTFLGQKLAEIGASLDRQVSMNDDPGEMAQCLREAVARADLVITTGGLGPTGDDLTRDCVIETFGLKTRINSITLKNIETRFRRRRTRTTAAVRSQAIVPQTAIVFQNRHGTAPGLAIPLKKSLSVERLSAEALAKRDRALRATSRCSWLIMLPGPPRELRPMFEKQALPLILKQFGRDLPAVDCRVFRVAGMGESLVEQRVHGPLMDLKNKNAHKGRGESLDLEIGYCARPGEVDLRLVARGSARKPVRRLADEAERKAFSALGKCIFGKGSQTLEEVVVELLRNKRKSLSTAESCTGGYVAHRITLVPGSSDVFLQGWVTYSNSSKTSLLGIDPRIIKKDGAASESVARQMAENARIRSGSDFALSLTGIAGPSGGSPQKPVGTVYIALASVRGAQVDRFCFPLDRETFKFICAQTSLNMLRKELMRPIWVS